MSHNTFKIQNGKLAFELVDEAAVGYLEEWQTPTGVTLPTIGIAAYDPSTAGYGCQLVTGVVESTQNSTSTTEDGGWCDEPTTVVTVGEPSFALRIDAWQDVTSTASFSAFLYRNRGKDAYVYVDMGGNGAAGRVVGVVTLDAGSIGGGRNANRMTPSFPFRHAPDVEFASGEVVLGYGDDVVALEADAELEDVDGDTVDA